jgi:hypothetical protein
VADHVTQARRQGREQDRDRQLKTAHALNRRWLSNLSRRRTRARGQRLKIKREIACRLKPLVGILFQAVPYDAIQRWRNAAIYLRQFGQVFLQDGGHRLGSRIPAEGALAGEHLEQNCSEYKDVRTMIDRNAAHLLRRHVAGGAQNLPSFSQGKVCRGQG